MATAKVTPVQPIEATESKPKRKRRASKREAYSLPEGVAKYNCVPDDWAKIDLAYFAGYDAKKHGPLRPRHFANKASYFAYVAFKNQRECEAAVAKAKHWHEHGDDMRAASALRKLVAQQAKLREQLAGVDPSVLAEMGIDLSSDAIKKLLGG